MPCAQSRAIHLSNCKRKYGMNVIPVRQLSLIVFVACTLLALAPTLIAQTKSPRQDITGGARLIFGRIENPSIIGGRTPQEATRSSSVREKVNDALALGNGARDRTPPDLQAAEKAYKLAWKLNPRDPRPYVGLGNVYMDQGRYVDAAKAYHDAIRLGGTTAASVRGTSVTPTSMPERTAVAQWHAYRGLALIEAQRYRMAEKELMDAIVADPSKAEWRAGLGYSLFVQDRFTEAASAYQTATELQTGTNQYNQLLDQTRAKANQAAAHDDTIGKQIEGTVWETPLTPATAKGVCRLLPTAAVECTASGTKVQAPAVTWKVQDGLFQLIRPATDEPLCIGRVADSEIQLKCFANDVETSVVWRRQ